MSTKRVLLGNMGGGVYGLKVSRSGYDVTTCDPNDPVQTSFYSQWPDMVRVLDGGYASSNSNLPTAYPVTDPGYIPWIEARLVSGTTVYDDRTPFTWGPTYPNSMDGLDIASQRGQISLPGTPTGSAILYTIVYVVFNVPVATQ